MFGLEILCNGQEYPLILDTSEGPFFSWKYRNCPAKFMQAAYRIRILKEGSPVWDSGKVNSPAQYMIPYGGPKLEEFGIYDGEVSVWGEKRGAGKAGAGAAGSGHITLESGISPERLGRCKWIGGDRYLRRDFTVEGGVKRALAYITAAGVYELSINGKRAGDWELMPTFTDFEKRIEYQCYDITSLVKDGGNAAGIILDEGVQADSLFRVPEPFVICCIRITTGSGKVIEVKTGEDWDSMSGPLLKASVWRGERYDGRLEKPGWDTAGYKGKTKKVKVYKKPSGILFPMVLPPMKITSEIKPVSVREVEKGIYVADYGVNVTGVIRLRVKGRAGTEVVMRPAELLLPDGHADQRNLRMNDCYDSYILKGGGAETHTPRFTYHGFRYAEFSGLPAKPAPGDITLCVIHHELEDWGSFVCSDDQFNRIHAMMRQTLINNLHSVPTDCCQRNERQGWMGDATCTSEAIMYNWYTHWFYRKWLDDIADIVNEDGSIDYGMAPRWMKGNYFPWCISLFLIPMFLYRYYDDAAILKKMYPLQKRAMAHYETHIKSSGLIEDTAPFTFYPDDRAYMDWLATDRTMDILVTNGLLCLELKYMAESALLLKQEADRKRYLGIMEKLKKAFHDKFYEVSCNEGETGGNYGHVFGNSQYGSALAMDLGITPPELYETVLDAFIWDLKESRGSTQLSTGVLSTKYVTEFLEKIGRNDIVDEVFRRKDFPGWGFMLSKGATTVWERWQYHTRRMMDSHDHPAFAAPDIWLYRALGGVSYGYAGKDGRRVFVLKPFTPEHISFAETSLETPWGLVTMAWRREKGGIVYSYNVPPNTTAELCIGGKTKTVYPGSYQEFSAR
ncbi:MAG: glycoside hydrolase family 78 protein [Treponema sp.]|jgi:alpha-L-rhamnosidase|nr:glycoside hydrolase family 78 protein [Treponema sp.]